MARLRSNLDCGENTGGVVLDRGEKAEVVLDFGDTTGVVAHTVCDIDPDDPSNIKFLLAFEWTQADPQSLCSNDVAS